MAIPVSDANIFIDMDVGNLTRPMFRLDETFATPDVLYREELQAASRTIACAHLESIEPVRPVDLGRPVCWAMVRTLQCVALGGRVCGPTMRSSHLLKPRTDYAAYDAKRGLR